jgi:hypothetical protein
MPSVKRTREAIAVALDGGRRPVFVRVDDHPDVARVGWSSVEFSERLPIVWCHPRKKRAPFVCVRLTFRSAAEMQELVSTLQGALNALKREKAAGRGA